MRLRKAREADVAPLLALINGYADRGLLLRRSEESLRSRLDDFTVAVGAGRRDRRLRRPHRARARAGRGALPGRARGPRGAGPRATGSWSTCSTKRRRRGFDEVLALTRRPSFFEALGFAVTRRERFLDKLMVDCKACPMNLCCDETAMVRVPPRADAADALASRSALE